MCFCDNFRDSTVPFCASFSTMLFSYFLSTMFGLDIRNFIAFKGHIPSSFYQKIPVQFSCSTLLSTLRMLIFFHTVRRTKDELNISHIYNIFIAM